MSLPADYHMHSRFSDGEGELQERVERAIELGLPEVGFSDHLVPAGYDQPGYGVPRRSLDEYLDAARAAAGAAASRGLRVLVGAEVDYMRDAGDEMAALVEAHAFDYLICSVHYVDRFAFDASPFKDDVRWDDPDAIFMGAYETLRHAAAWAAGRADVIGHFDLPKKFGHRPRGDVTAAEDAALDAIAEAGPAIELNTAGWRRDAGEPYPALAILARARARGIRLTFGSDAHRASEVGFRFADAVALAREAGYRSWLRLSDRTEVTLP